MLQKCLFLPSVGDGAARGLLPALSRPGQNPVFTDIRCISTHLPPFLRGDLGICLGRERRRGVSTPPWPPLRISPRGGGTHYSPFTIRRLHLTVNTEISPETDTAHTATSRDSQEKEGNTKTKKEQSPRRHHGKGQKSPGGLPSQQPELAPSTCGFSYSKFVRKCSECLTDRQLERVAVRLKAYKSLKKAPRPQNRLAVLRDIEKIIPKEHRGELMKLLTDSLDVVDPHHFLRLSKACSERLAAQDEVGDGMPQSIMGDYTVGAELLRSHHGDETSQHSSRPAGEDPQNNFHSADPLGEEYQNIQREIATRPPTPTRLTEKRIGEFVVDWQDPSIPEPGSRSKNLVFLSNLPHAPRHVLTDILCKAFSGCGKIQRLEIFDDRLRTLDQTEDNTLQEKGEQAIRDKLERRFSPICALAEFSSTQEKQNACSTYLRTFGVPCIDRLVYPEDAAVKTTLIATNLPFILTPDEIARILSFALVHDAEASSHYPGVCRIRMTNPKLFGYEQLFVEARSDAEEPFFLLPLHRKLSNTDVAVRASGPECANDRNDKLQSSRKIRKNSPSTLRTSLESDASENLPNKASSVSVDFGKHVLQDKWAEADSSNGYGEYLDVVSAAADESIFIPSIIGLQTEEEMRDQQGRVPGPHGKKIDLGRHVVKKVLMNRLVLNNDGLFVLRFASFEAAEAAVRRCRGAVIYDSKALLLFSPRRCVFHNGQLVDFVIPEGNFAAESKPFASRA